MMLQPPRSEVQPYFDRLLEPCKEYTSNVSRRQMALSIETSAYLWWLCDAVEARSVVDLGSGFSSYVLRRYAGHAPYEVTVASVDDSSFWLKQTAGYLTENALPIDGLYRDDVWRRDDRKWEVIVHDIAGGDVRNEWMGVAAAHLADGGVLIFDDAQHREHHLHMARTAREYGLRLFDVFEQTVDQIGRYAAVAT